MGIILTEIDVEEMRSKLRLKDYNNKMTDSTKIVVLNP